MKTPEQIYEQRYGHRLSEMMADSVGHFRWSDIKEMMEEYAGQFRFAPDEAEEAEDDRDFKYSYEDEVEDEQERLLELAATCQCGAWIISKSGKALHVADCFCGAE